MKMKLQYFADPNTEPNPTDPKNPTGNDSKTTDSESKKPAKYTQDDLNRMMAAKAKEQHDKDQADLQKQLDALQAKFDSQKEDLIEQGKQFAGETAQQAAERQLKAREERVARKEKEQQKKDKEQREKDALNAAKELLTKHKLPTSFANYVKDPDKDVLANNVEKVAETWKQHVDTAVQDKVKGQVNPQTGGQTIPDNVTKADFAKMDVSQRMELYTKNPQLYKQLKN